MLDLAYEKEIFNQGFCLVGAIDEAGRGSLAGPVVAACVLVGLGFRISAEMAAINDSKKLTAKRREQLFDIIQKNFKEVGIGICEPDTIDRVNIFQATFLAMKKAIGALRHKPDMIILDGKFPIPNTSFKQKAVIRGDSTVFSIAAASIIAKVTRDRIMQAAHVKFPQYGFDRHKGYGTRLHLEKLKEHGSCILHHRSFRPVGESNGLLPSKK